MLLPQATALVIDYAIPDADRQAVLHIGAGLALGAVGAALFQLVQGVSLLRLEHGATATMQAAMWDWLLRLPPTFFRRHSVGDLESRVSAIRDMRLKLSGTTIRTLFAGVTACLNLGLMFITVPPWRWWLRCHPGGGPDHAGGRPSLYARSTS
jgi:ABC-type bacteriocin/lantibiotic exporter with double-glycine peptidase domain